MNTNRINLFRPILLLLLGSLIAVSCVPHRKMLYLQSENKNDTTLQFENERAMSYLLQAGDNLYIKVVSLDEKTTNLFNPLTSTNNSNTNDQSIYLNSYTVDENGNIDFPLAGKVLVQNLNVEQVKEKIQEVLDKYLKETVLIVKLVDFKLTVLGEVRRPGPFKVYQSEINIFEAIAMSGDMTEFSNREAVTIIRQTKNGSEIVTVDLEKATILTSEYYYLRPNDIVYVKPLKMKQYGFATFPYALVFTTITTALLLINYFNK